MMSLPTSPRVIRVASSNSFPLSWGTCSPMYAMRT